MPLNTRKSETLLVNVVTHKVNAILRLAILRIAFLGMSGPLVLGYVSNQYWKFSINESIVFGICTYAANASMNISVLAIALALRTRNFLAIASTGIMQNGFTLFFQILFLQYTDSVSTLIFAYFAGRILALLGFLFWKNFRNTLKQFRVVHHMDDETKALQSEKNHLFYSSLLDQISLYSPILICFLLNEQELLGASALALNFALAPATLIISGFSMQFLSHQYAKDDEKKEIIKHSLFTLLALCLIYLTAIIGFALIFSENFFGSEWRGIDRLIIAFSIAITFMIFISPYLQLKISYGHSETVMRANIAGLFGVVIVWVLGYSQIPIERVVSFALFGKVLGQSFILCFEKVFHDRNKS